MTIDSPEFRKILIAMGAAIGIPYTYNALIAHIDAWGARLAGEAAKDSARVDFMIAEECQIERMDRPGSAPLYRVRWPWHEEHMRFWHETGRKAIDAAMLAAAPAPDKEPPCGS